MRGHAGSAIHLPTHLPLVVTAPPVAALPQNRWVLYKKGLEGEVDIAPPRLLGDKGTKSPAYLALNPQGKMPVLVLPDGQALPESAVIEAYLLDKYAGVGPSLLPPTPEARGRAALASQILGLYITPIQVRCRSWAQWAGWAGRRGWAPGLLACAARRGAADHMPRVEPAWLRSSSRAPSPPNPGSRQQPPGARPLPHPCLLPAGLHV